MFHHFGAVTRALTLFEFLVITKSFGISDKKNAFFIVWSTAHAVEQVHHHDIGQDVEVHHSWLVEH